MIRNPFKWISGIMRENKEQIAIDFDGVIHSNSSGNPIDPIDGPIEGAKDALAMLSLHYKVVVYTCRARKDRPNNGVKTVQKWLEKYHMSKYVHSITATKPRAIAYIDDKALKFESWEQVKKELKSRKI